MGHHGLIYFVINNSLMQPQLCILPKVVLKVGSITYTYLKGGKVNTILEYSMCITQTVHFMNFL